MASSLFKFMSSIGTPCESFFMLLVVKLARAGYDGD